MTPRQALKLAGWTDTQLERWEGLTHGIDYLDIELESWEAAYTVKLGADYLRTEKGTYEADTQLEARAQG